MDYKEKYIELQKAVSDLKRGKPTEKTMAVLYGWDTCQFKHVNEELVAHAFDRRDREMFVKRLNAEKVDLYRLYWLKSERDAVRKILSGMDESHPEHKWFMAVETILDGLLTGTFISFTC